jgi:hypothetical protein
MTVSNTTPTTPWACMECGRTDRSDMEFLAGLCEPCGVQYAVKNESRRLAAKYVREMSNGSWASAAKTISYTQTFGYDQQFLAELSALLTTL